MESYWIEFLQNRHWKQLEQNTNTEVTIIGGGITGLTCAYYLAKAGKKVIVLEKDLIMSHASGNTTAKITSQHGLFYDYLLQSLGKDKAKQYLDANQQAINNIEKIVKQEKINCDFEKQSAYVFTKDIQELEKIKKEVEVVKSLGLDCYFREQISLPISILGAIEFPDQAQFNPAQYALGLYQAIEKYGGTIYEKTKVYDVKKAEDGYDILTQDYHVKSKYVILACHYPIINAPGFYFMKMYQQTSYLIGAEVSQEVFQGMYINSEKPTISYRTVPAKDKKLILVGGMDHKTGAKIDISNSYDFLEEQLKQIYASAIVKYRWNTQDVITVDKIPYIGEFSHMTPNMYIATGYKKWGMTSSNVAANIITDRILEKENKYQEVFKSTRFHPIKNHEEVENILKETTHSLILNKFTIPNDTLEQISKDDGKIIEIEKQKVGVYKDKEGKIYMVKPVCSHLGCELTFNSLDKTWDCPCHGSRFNYLGESIYDPSIKPLQKYHNED